MWQSKSSLGLAAHNRKVGFLLSIVNSIFAIAIPGWNGLSQAQLMPFFQNTCSSISILTKRDRPRGIFTKCFRLVVTGASQFLMETIQIRNIRKAPVLVDQDKTGSVYCCTCRTVTTLTTKFSTVSSRWTNSCTAPAFRFIRWSGLTAAVSFIACPGERKMETSGAQPLRAAVSICGWSTSVPTFGV